MVSLINEVLSSLRSRSQLVWFPLQSSGEERESQKVQTSFCFYDQSLVHLSHLQSVLGNPDARHNEGRAQ